jgi:hypothetical protein
VTHHPSSSTLEPGYYLVGSFIGLSTGGALDGYAIVLDQNGVPVWYARDPQMRPVLDVDYNQVPGKLSFTYQPPSGNPTPNTRRGTTATTTNCNASRRQDTTSRLPPR